MYQDLFKYPSTSHLEGSSLQPGDDAALQVSYEKEVAGRYIVVEEKLDGANSGNSFSPDADPLQQCRGHYLTGGWKERHFNRFKQWCARHMDVMFDRLADQYLMFGEWAYAKHTIFYNNLPHYFFEFDIWDKATGDFLSTAARARVLAGAPVLPVPVLYAGIAPPKLADLLEYIMPWSLAKAPGWQVQLKCEAVRAGVDPDRAMRETFQSDGPEGLYIKIEEGDRTVGRYKWVRHGFLQVIKDNKTHWHDRPIIRNLLADGVDLDSDTLQVTWENLPFLPRPADLLSRDDFRTQVLGRLGGRCCLCPNPAVDAHHILDRKLFSAGGYHLNNGAPLCASCHLDAEQSRVSVETIRQACGITEPLLAPGLFPGKIYDKWGVELP